MLRVPMADGQPETHRCPDNGAKVNVSDCSITKNVGRPSSKRNGRTLTTIPAPSLLLRSRAGESYLPVVHLGRYQSGRTATPRSAKDAAGKSLDVADLGHAGKLKDCRNVARFCALASSLSSELLAREGDGSRPVTSATMSSKPIGVIPTSVKPSSPFTVWTVKSTSTTRRGSS